MPRPLLLVCLLVAVPVAGCLASDAGPEIDPTLPPEPRTEGPAFADPVRLPGDRGAAEPNLAILDDGTIFVTAPTGLQDRPNAAAGAAYLWRSTDGGETWTTIRSPEKADRPGPVRDAGLAWVAPFCSCDADVVTSPDGWTYYTDWWSAGLAVGNYLVERSPDGGETWEAAPVTIPRLVTLTVDRQWLVAGEDGFVGLFYSYSAPNPNPNRIEAVFSRDHGATWSDPVTVVPGRQGVFHQIAHPRVVGDGTLVMPYGDMTGGWRDPASVRLAVSEDGGTTWDHRLVAEAPEGLDNLWAVQGAVGGDGTVHVAWGARTGERMPMFHAASEDLGRNWSGPHVLQSQGLNFLPWVAARDDGRVAVGWYGGNATGNPTDAPADATWYAHVAERPPNGSWSVRRVSDAPVKAGPLCPRGASCSDDRELLDYVSLDYGPDGDLTYAFARSETVMESGPAAAVHVASETR